MIKNDFFNTLDFMTLPSAGGVVSEYGDLALYDNIGDNLEQRIDFSNDPATLSIISSSYPYKITFTLVIVCLGGTMSARLNLADYELGKNDVLIVTPGMIGECVMFSRDCRIAMMAFSQENMFAGMNVSCMVAISSYVARNAKVRIADADMEDFLDIYMALRKKISEKDYAYKKELIAGYMQVLCCNAGQIVRSIMSQNEIPDSSTGVADRSARLYDAFISEVSRHYADERSVAYYAGKLCISPKYLSRVVASVSGRRPVDWIRDYVVLEAKALLKSGKYTVQQVADMLHFPNQSFFGTYFKKATGISPMAYNEA